MQNGTRVIELFELIHFHVDSSIKNTSYGGAKYFVTFIDDFSKKNFV